MVDEYARFLTTMRTTPTIVPTVATDFVWHTHMLFPRRYAAEVRSIVGHEVDHDDNP